MVDGPFGSDLKSEEYVDEGVPLIQLNNIGVGVHTASNLKFITEDKAATLARHCAVPGDLVIAKMAEPVARAAVVSNDFPRYTIVADCIKLSVDATEWLPQFLNYWMNSAVVRSIAEVYSAGITRLRINLGAVKKLPVFELPLPEQNAIADFLDRETAKIDTLVAEQEQLITLLKEKRQAVISHAVTKGLDPSVPMKDSGVEWLGEVPAHWRTSALKHICDVRDGTHDTPQFLAPSEDTFPFVTTKDLGGGRVSFEEAKHISREDFENFARRSRVDLGDVLMPMIGSIGGAVLVDTGEAFAIKNIALFKGADHFDPRWLTHFLNSDLSSVQFDLNRSGGVQGFVALSVLRDLRIPVPPKIEQVEIADSLSKALANINDLIGLASESIATLQERRATLISAAVTGQIDIRGESNDIKS
jgi:type I restriction enzyme S subunit